MKIGIITDPHLSDENNKKTEDFESFAPNISAHCDVLVVSGDMASTNPHEAELFFKIARRNNPYLPIVFVRGNHDVWAHTPDFRSISDIFLFQEKFCKKYKIHDLEFNGELVINDVSFVGYMGWYASRNNDTKDYERIPRQNSLGADTFSFFKKLEGDSLDKIADMELSGKKKVCVTHFNLLPNKGYENLSGNPRFFELFLKDKFDLVIMGHSHKKMDKVIDGCRVVNAGADYSENPGNFFKVIEI